MSNLRNQESAGIFGQGDIVLVKAVHLAVVRRNWAVIVLAG